MQEELNKTESPKQKCTFLFNVALTLLVMYASVSSWLFNPVNNGSFGVFMGIPLSSLE